MPAPAQTSREEIVRAGRDLVEAGGLAALTMQAVAAAVGIRAPSIYKRVRDRDELIRLVTESVAQDLSAVLDDIPVCGDSRTDLRTLLAAARTFAHDHPRAYALIYSPVPDTARPDTEVLARASGRLLDLTSDLVGDEQALPAARTVVAWLHGFVIMDLAGAFRLGGDVEAAFGYGAERIIDALTGP